MQAKDLFSHLRNNCFDLMSFIPSLWLRRTQYFKLNFPRYTMYDSPENSFIFIFPTDGNEMISVD